MPLSSHTLADCVPAAILMDTERSKRFARTRTGQDWQPTCDTDAASRGLAIPRQVGVRSTVWSLNTPLATARSIALVMEVPKHCYGRDDGLLVEETEQTMRDGKHRRLRTCLTVGGMVI